MIVHLDLSQNCTGEEVSLDESFGESFLFFSFLFFEDDRLMII